MAGECSNTRGEYVYRHVALIGDNRAAAAAVYPPKLVRGLLQAFKEESAREGGARMSLSSFSAGPVVDEGEIDISEEKMEDD
eukprot:3760091-Prorocentrum_lima.AAC.1